MPVSSVFTKRHIDWVSVARNSISSSFSSVSFRSSLPIIVSVSPNKTPALHLSPPAILRRAQSTLHSSLSSLQNIHTTFFKDLIHQHGTNTVSCVTQCVLDVALIVSVHASLPYLQTSANDSNEDYRRKYQQIIDPLKHTSNGRENINIEPDILEFYGSIKKNKANIRNAQSKLTPCFDTRLTVFF